MYELIDRTEPIIKPQTLAKVGIKTNFETWHSRLSHLSSTKVSQVISQSSLACSSPSRLFYAIHVLVIRVINFLSMTLVLSVINLWNFFISMFEALLTFKQLMCSNLMCLSLIIFHATLGYIRLKKNWCHKGFHYVQDPI